MRGPSGRSWALILLALLSFAVLALVVVRLADPPGEGIGGAEAVEQRPGPVLLVPGYGGSTAGLEVLAQALRAEGRVATVVPLPGDGTGDLRASADALEAAVEASGAESVDVIGYSAGGLVARLWARDNASDVRRVVTLGSPHHGTRLASLGAAYNPGACPAACLQMVPGSDLLEELNREDETPDGPQWLSLWTTQDQVVTPPESARLDGAVNVALQELCPGLQLDHNGLPVSPVVISLVLQAVSADELRAPATCPTS